MVPGTKLHVRCDRRRLRFVPEDNVREARLRLLLLLPLQGRVAPKSGTGIWVYFNVSAKDCLYLRQSSAYLFLVEFFKQYAKRPRWGLELATCATPKIYYAEGRYPLDI